MKDHEDLFQFFGSYFHQDWMHEHDDPIPEHVIDRYRQESRQDVGHLIRLGDAVTEFSHDPCSDSELREKLYTELGCYYVPKDIRAWLRDVGQRLSAPFDGGEQ